MTTEVRTARDPAPRAVETRMRPSAEDVAWIGLWPAALALLAAIAWLGPPLSDLLPDPSTQFFVEAQPLIKPEPLEQARFLLAVVAPLGLAGIVIWLGSAAPAQRRLDLPAIALQLGLAALVVWAVLEQEHELPLLDPDYFSPLLLSVPVLVAGVVIGAGLFALALARRWPFAAVAAPARISSGRRWAAFAIALALTALWLLPAVFTDANLSEGGAIPSGHVPVQAQDFYAVTNGLTPMVDYIAQYVQLLPLVFAPVLEPFDLSITASSVLMVVLSVLALLAIYGVFLRVTGRPLAALSLYVPFLALALFPWSDEGLRHEFNGSYYAFFPGRYLGPFVVAWLATRGDARTPAPDLGRLLRRRAGDAQQRRVRDDLRPGAVLRPRPRRRSRRGVGAGAVEARSARRRSGSPAPWRSSSRSSSCAAASCPTRGCGSTTRGCSRARRSGSSRCRRSASTSPFTSPSSPRS